MSKIQFNYIHDISKKASQMSTVRLIQPAEMFVTEDAHEQQANSVCISILLRAEKQIENSFR